MIKVQIASDIMKRILELFAEFDLVYVQKGMLI